RNSASGTYGYFKEHALFKGDYKDEVKEQPGSSSVVQGVASDRYAIGYSGIGYKTTHCHEGPLKETATVQPIPPTSEFAHTAKDPLARFLYIYVNYKQGTELDPLRREFIRYVYSKDGQFDVIKDGYFPVNARVAAEELAKLGLNL